MGVIGWILLGLGAGLVAKHIVPGDGPGGLILTVITGVAGALVGGAIAQTLGYGAPIGAFFDLSTWAGAIGGSIVLLLFFRVVAASLGNGPPGP